MKLRIWVWLWWIGLKTIQEGGTCRVHLLSPKIWCFSLCRVQVLGIVVVALIWINGLSTMEEIPDIYVDGEEETIDHPMPDVAKNTYIVASLDSHLWVLLFLFLLIKCSIIGLLLKYLLQTLESVRMDEPQLQHCWVDFRSCWWKQFLIHMSFSLGSSVLVFWWPRTWWSWVQM